MLRRGALATVLLLATSAFAWDFLGSESCQSCHPDAFAAWQGSAHARARDVLSPLQQKDARCLSCHSPSEQEQRVANVGCESCHGGGQYYAARYVMKDADLARMVGLIDPGEKSCKSCHDGSSPSLKPFDFVAKLKLIDHWSVERAKRGASGAKVDAAPVAPAPTTAKAAP